VVCGSQELQPPKGTVPVVGGIVVGVGLGDGGQAGVMAASMAPSARVRASLDMGACLPLRW